MKQQQRKKQKTTTPTTKYIDTKALFEIPKDNAPTWNRRWTSSTSKLPCPTDAGIANADREVPKSTQQLTNLSRGYEQMLAAVEVHGRNWQGIKAPTNSTNGVVSAGSVESAIGGGKPGGSLNLLIKHEPVPLKTVVTEEYTEIEFGVDSGASDSVIGSEMLPGIELKEGEAQRRGVTYEIANGDILHNLGEKQFVGYSEEEVERSMTAQVTDVNQALLSVRTVSYTHLTLPTKA